MFENNFCKMEFTRDQDGQELLLKDEKFQVMMEWEKPYMHACIDALAPQGDVLEVGFGCGYASTHIQTYKPISHTIIEYHPIVTARAKLWANDYSNINIIENTWQNAMKALGSFDAIFFDDYPLESEQDGIKIEEKKKYAHSILEKGQQALDEIDQKLSFLKTITYTRQDIDSFFKLLKQGDSHDPNLFLRFFSDLKKNNNIDDKLFSYALTILIGEKLVTSKNIEEFEKSQNQEKTSPVTSFNTQGDRLFNFLQLCLQDHMKNGSVFSCYLEDPTSKLEDEKFYKNIITNPFLEYKEKVIPIQVPPHCEYYKGDKALVITIKKM